MAACSKCSEDWKLILNPFENKHLPFGDTSNPVKYVFTSCTSPIQTVSTVGDLGLFLNTKFCADDNVVRATKKIVNFFYLKQYFEALAPGLVASLNLVTNKLLGWLSC